MAKEVIAILLCIVLALASCEALPMDGNGGSGVGNVSAGDEDYDFSVFFGHAEDPINIARIALRYKAETGVSVRPIMTAEDAADDRFLTRYMSSADPPAAFALPTDASDNVSAAGIGWRFHGRGFAADRRVLADLIGLPDAAAPAVDIFVEDIRLADYGEWSKFLNELDSYIKGDAYSTFILNDKTYSFAGSKGRYSSQLSGVFAVSGADSLFTGTMLMDMASVTTDIAPLADLSLLTTPQAFMSIQPVFDTYIEALGSYTSHIAGLYAPGIRGDDFISGKIYSSEYTELVFEANRAVFTPFDSENYTESADATQAGHIALLPIKMPYGENWLRVYRGGAVANSSLQMRTEYSFCVNEEAPSDIKAKAEAFVRWLADDTESSGAIQLCLADYHAKGAELPLPTAKEREEAEGIAMFGEYIYDSILRHMLSDPDWQPDEMLAFRDALFAEWLSGNDGGY
ncbi:MAG: hypothetical protein LBO70_06105 [Clostridiales Family XIII bacterium]|jgi:hypothetical protein|nr:hypothetical protein [Clostridiales Family XIII bacterium]